MAVFRNRPLAMACIGFVLITPFCFLLPWAFILALAASALLAVAVLFCLHIKRGFFFPRFFALLVLLFVSLGVIRGCVARISLEEISDRYDGQTVNAVLVVDSVEAQGSYGSGIIVKVRSINGEKCSFKAYLKTEDLFPFYVGDRFEGEFLCGAIDTDRKLDPSARQLFADGIKLCIYPEENTELRLVESGVDSFSARCAELSTGLAFKIKNAVGGKGGELLAALLLGEKDDLSPETVRDFRRIGVSHLLALSGLHLSLLMLLINGLLSCFRVGKRWRIAALVAATVSYLILTGCAVSTLRAALMLGVTFLAFFAASDHDAMTSLCFVGALLTLVNPGVVFDLSFQLTMLATFGILSFGRVDRMLSRIIPSRKGATGVFLFLLRKLLGSLIITFSSSIAILPIQWIVFGEISLITPLANLLLVPAMLPLLLGAALILVLSPLPMLCSAVAVPIGLLSRLVLSLAGSLSQTDCMLSLNYDFVPYILLPLLAINLALLLVDLKRLSCLVFVPTLLAGAIFSLCLGISFYHGNSEIDLIYRRSGVNEGIALAQNDVGVIIDISNGSYTQLYSDYALLREHRISEIEAIVLTHYHSSQQAAISRLSKQALVRSLYLPEPVTENDSAVLASLREMAEERGISVILYCFDEALLLPSDLSFTLSQPIYRSRSTQPAFCFELEFGDQSLRYESVSYREYRLQTGTSPLAVDCDYFLLGAHGPIPKASIDLSKLGAKELTILASEAAMPLFGDYLQGEAIFAPSLFEVTFQK